MKTDSWPPREGRPRALLRRTSIAPRRGTSPKGAARAPDRPTGLALGHHLHATRIVRVSGWHKARRTAVTAPATGPTRARLALRSKGSKVRAADSQERSVPMAVGIAAFPPEAPAYPAAHSTPEALPEGPSATCRRSRPGVCSFRAGRSGSRVRYVVADRRADGGDAVPAHQAR